MPRHAPSRWCRGSFYKGSGGTRACALAARERLYLVDASIYIYRAWQSQPPELHDRYGQPVNALIGFADSLRYILHSRQPVWIACGFDECRERSIRRRIYPAYKSQRPLPPAALEPQLARCQHVAEAFGIAVFSSQAVEADDLIGGLAAMARQNDRPVTIVSGDKDLAQFVGPGDRYWDLARDREYDSEALTRRFRVRPEQIPDWLALCGDRSDNIPGVPGIGRATAARLLRKWGTLDILLANTAAVAGMRFRGAPRVSALLHTYRTRIRLSRRLTGCLPAPGLPATLCLLRREIPDTAELRSRFEAIGFTARQAARLAA